MYAADILKPRKLTDRTILEMYPDNQVFQRNNSTNKKAHSIEHQGQVTTDKVSHIDKPDASKGDKLQEHTEDIFQHKKNICLREQSTCHRCHKREDPH